MRKRIGKLCVKLSNQIWVFMRMLSDEDKMPRGMIKVWYGLTSLIYRFLQFSKAKPGVIVIPD